MPYLKWDESPHWYKLTAYPQKNEEPILIYKTTRQIIDEVRDDPKYNAINPSNQAHIIEQAINLARNSGILIEEGELING